MRSKVPFAGVVTWLALACCGCGSTIGSGTTTGSGGDSRQGMMGSGRGEGRRRSEARWTMSDLGAGVPRDEPAYRGLLWCCAQAGMLETARPRC